ncbi:hypothetical protein EDC94DRAFT_649348 [Helicostylum pulchrum]|nr:hypothetical protein EDC94DRAFT_649348 [Helicostylum pulchrum]
MSKSNLISNFKLFQPNFFFPTSKQSFQLISKPFSAPSLLKVSIKPVYSSSVCCLCEGNTHLSYHSIMPTLVRLRFHCFVCDTGFTFPQNLKRHLLLHQIVVRTTGRLRRYNTPEFTYYTSTTRTNDDFVWHFSCPSCIRHFLHLEDLRVHFYSDHGEQASPPPPPPPPPSPPPQQQQQQQAQQAHKRAVEALEEAQRAHQRARVAQGEAQRAQEEKEAQQQQQLQQLQQQAQKQQQQLEERQYLFYFIFLFFIFSYFYIFFLY